MLHNFGVGLLWVAKVENLIYELVDEDEVGSQILFFQRTAEVMDATYDGSE